VVSGQGWFSSNHPGAQVLTEDPPTPMGELVDSSQQGGRPVHLGELLDPNPNPASVVTCGTKRAKFTLLTSRLIRVEVRTKSPPWLASALLC